MTLVCRSQTAGFTASDATWAVSSPCSGESRNFTQSSASQRLSVFIRSGQAEACIWAAKARAGSKLVVVQDTDHHETLPAVHAVFHRARRPVTMATSCVGPVARSDTIKRF
jgi:hypothetical protein